MSVAIPHCAPRNVASREPVIKMRQNDGSWVELPTKEVTLEDIKVLEWNCIQFCAKVYFVYIYLSFHYQEYKFVEVRLSDPDAVLATVTRTRRETFTIHKRGGKLNSSVDARVCLCFKQSTFRSSTDITLEVAIWNAECPVCELLLRTRLK